MGFMTLTDEDGWSELHRCGAHQLCVLLQGGLEGKETEIQGLGFQY